VLVNCQWEGAPDDGQSVLTGMAIGKSGRIKNFETGPRVSTKGVAMRSSVLSSARVMPRNQHGGFENLKVGDFDVDN
jgi:hypothetical protein